MAEYAAKQDVQEIVDRAIDKAVTDLSEIISNFAQQVDNRFNAVEAKQHELDKKFDRLLNTIDSFVGRIDRYESEQIARDSQFNRLLEWARRVSEKTGIPLENL
jgi:predicted RecB family endonuclease